ncbi:hypothetical protein Ddc_04481 [Ditylenchus destructor]|nr:hypothetical protein Ddc_04481 [Ditylenchus destructor]
MSTKVACRTSARNLTLFMLIAAISLISLTNAQLFGMGPSWGGNEGWGSNGGWGSSGNDASTGAASMWLMCTSVNCGRG